MSSAGRQGSSEAEKPDSQPSNVRNVYRDRPSEDGKYGDGGADPSGIGEESRRPGGPAASPELSERL